VYDVIVAVAKAREAVVTVKSDIAIVDVVNPVKDLGITVSEPR
jgi:hypothetical protein